MRFHFEDYLNLFSIDDLRELAQRRGFMLPQSALNSRQGLVRRLSATLERPESVYPVLFGLNAAELAVLGHVLGAKGGTGLSRLAGKLELESPALTGVLESLRRLGLLFPEGNWESIVVPPPSRSALNYVPALGALERKKEPVLTQPPAPEPAVKGPVEPRVASISWDLAEFLARIARSRLKLTQAGRINRRDLKALEAAFAVPSSGYPTFLYLLAAGQGLLLGWEGLLVVREGIDDWFSLREEARLDSLLTTWMGMRAFSESSTGNPEDAEYVPSYLPLQRTRMAELLGELRGSVTVASLAAQLAWRAPLTFEQWDANRDPAHVSRRLLRSLYWLGLAALDHPETPESVALTAAGARVFGQAEAPAAIPEEAQFFLQPNAEIFAPPNLQPRTLFHLRRITGEKKGGPAGMYPITADSLRRGLDSGLTVAQVVQFLERFSRTGLPDNVRALVETTGRQHGRIRLVPAGYVVVTEDAALMDELRTVKTVSPLLGAPLTERVSALGVENVTELLKRLRARGYAPADLGEARQELHLPDDPHAPLSDAPPGPATERSSGELDWSRLEHDTGEGDDTDGPAPGERVTDRMQILDLLHAAVEEGLEVEIGYHARSRDEDSERVVWPEFLEEHVMDAYCTLRQDHRQFAISRIKWARLTGQEIPDEQFL